MKRKISILILFISSFASFAEGTKELGDFSTTNGGIFISLADTTYSPFGFYNAPEEYQIKISVSDLTETVFYGLQTRDNARNLTTIPYRIISPDGNVFFTSNTPNTSEPGYINSYLETINGPDPSNVIGGYEPLSFIPDQTGDYVIEFNPDSTERICLTHFDVTVEDSTGTPQPGRLHSKGWQISSGGYDLANSMNAIVYPYHPSGVIFEVDLNGIIPWVFSIYFNSFGTDTTKNFLVDRKSKIGRAIFPEYNVFLNPPDENIFPANESNIEYNASLTQNGCESSLFCLEFLNSSPGIVNGFIDFNLNNVFEPELGDISFEEIIDSSGSTCIEWNGMDANGNKIGANEINLITRFGSGIMHLPLYDIEHNRNGYKVSIYKPISLPDPLIFWDDSLITEGDLLGSELINLTGCNSTTSGGCHQWEDRGEIGGNRPDQETINTWWYTQIEYDSVIFDYIPNNPVQVSYEPDSLVKEHELICAGDSVTFFVFNNNENHYDSSRYNYEWYIIDTNNIPVLVDSNKLTYVPYDTTEVFLKSIFKLNPSCTSIDSIIIETVDPIEGALLKIIDTICTDNRAEASIEFQTRQENPIMIWEQFPNFDGLERTDLTQGTYKIQVIDTNLSTRCAWDTSFSVLANHKIDILGVSDDSTFCYDSTGQVSIAMTNVNQTYEYSWNGTPFDDRDSLFNLLAGDYSVIVRDSLLNCTLDTIISVKPLAFTINGRSENEECTDSSGLIHLDIPSEKLTVTWNDISTQDTLRTGLSAGNYSVNISSDLVANCSLDTSFVIENITPDFSAFQLSFEPNNLIKKHTTICNLDTISFFVFNDGLSHYNDTTFTYNWYVDSNSIYTSNSSEISLLPHTDILIFAEAIYNTNSYCRMADTLKFDVVDALDVTLLVNDTICTENIAEASLNFTSLQNPTIYWNEFPNFHDSSRTDLTNGTYTISVIDSAFSANCAWDTTLNIEANHLIEIQSITEDSTFCYDSTGQVSIAMTNVNQTYEYSWNDAPFDDRDSLFNLLAGDYSVIVRDSLLNCTLDTVIPVYSLPLLVQAETSSMECNSPLGSIELFVPSDKLSIEWQDINTTTTLRYDLTEGNYTVSVYSNLSENCSFDSSFVIVNNDRPITFNSLDIIESNCYQKTGSIDIDIEPFTTIQDYIISWDNGINFNSNFSRDSLDAGIYNIIIQEEGTDCQIDTTLELNSNNDELDISKEDAICVSNNGSININVSNPSFTINWDDDSNNHSLERTNLTSGTYTYHLIHDENFDCNIVSTVTINTINTDLKANFEIEGYTQNTLVYSQDSLHFVNISNETTPIVNWTFSEGTTFDTHDFIYLIEDENHQTISLYIEDEYGCNATIERELEVTEYKNCKMAMPNAFTPNDDDYNDNIGVLGSPDDMELRIYNRWGELVFRSEDITDRWDGTFLTKQSPVGIYVYLLDYTCQDLKGNYVNKSEVGEISLMR